MFFDMLDLQKEKNSRSNKMIGFSWPVWQNAIQSVVVTLDASDQFRSHNFPHDITGAQ